MDELLDKELLEHALRTMPGWSRHDNAITKIFERKDFFSAMGFVTQVAMLAERADHHPDIDIRWNKVTLTLSTHSAGGVTSKDLALAKEIEDL